jgi:carbohydrate diacid regulator
MELTRVMADRLLKKLESTQPYDVVIINADGIVVSATDERIVGARHADATQRLREYRSQIQKSPGQKGSLPVKERGNGRCLFVHNQLVGAIGLSGREEQIMPYLEMAKTISELLLEQEMDIQTESVQKAPQAQILMRLLSQHTDKAKLRGALLSHEIDVNIPRTLLAVRFSPLAAETVTPAAQDPNRMEMLFQNAFNNALALFKRRFSFSGDLILPDAKNAMVFVFCMDRSYIPEQSAQKIAQICQLIVDDARLYYRLSAKVLIGERCCCLDDYDGQYYQIIENLGIGEHIFPKFSILHGKSLVLGNITSYIPEATKKAVVEHTFGKLLSSPQKDMYLGTLEQYFKNSMSIGDTAQNLYIHRNTLQHRFKKIEELTGYCVYNLDDLLTLRLALMFYRMQDA